MEERYPTPMDLIYYGPKGKKGVVKDMTGMRNCIGNDEEKTEFLPDVSHKVNVLCKELGDYISTNPDLSRKQDWKRVWEHLMNADAIMRGIVS